MAKVTPEPSEGEQAVSYQCKCGKQILLIHNDSKEKIKKLSFCWNCLQKLENFD